MEEAIMMDSAVFSQFSEHLKEAYGEKEHRGLAGVAANNAGAGKKMRKVIQAGGVGVDKGFTRPHNPLTFTQYHSPGGQAPGKNEANALAARARAEKPLARSMAQRQAAQTQGPIRRRITKLRADANEYQGAKNLGEASHIRADVSAHDVKPTQAGHASRLRAGPQIPGKNLATAAREHQKSGLKRKGTQVHANLDKLQPSKSSADAQAVKGQKTLGRNVASGVQGRAVSRYGMTPNDASKGYKTMMTNPQHGTAGRIIGGVKRNVNMLGRTAKHVGGSVSSSVTSVPKGLKRVVRAGLLRR